jgi:hypothetical protein
MPSPTTPQPQCRQADARSRARPTEPQAEPLSVCAHCQQGLVFGFRSIRSHTEKQGGRFARTKDVRKNRAVVPRPPSQDGPRGTWQRPRGRAVWRPDELWDMTHSRELMRLAGPCASATHPWQAPWCGRGSSARANRPDGAGTWESNGCVGALGCQGAKRHSVMQGIRRERSDERPDRVKPPSRPPSGPIHNGPIGRGNLLAACKVATQATPAPIPSRPPFERRIATAVHSWPEFWFQQTTLTSFFRPIVALPTCS